MLSVVPMKLVPSTVLALPVIFQALAKTWAIDKRRSTPLADDIMESDVAPAFKPKSRKGLPELLV